MTRNSVRSLGPLRLPARPGGTGPRAARVPRPRHPAGHRGRARLRRAPPGPAGAEPARPTRPTRSTPSLPGIPEVPRPQPGRSEGAGWNIEHSCVWTIELRDPSASQGPHPARDTRQRCSGMFAVGPSRRRVGWRVPTSRAIITGIDTEAGEFGSRGRTARVTGSGQFPWKPPPFLDREANCRDLEMCSRWWYASRRIPSRAARKVATAFSRSCYYIRQAISPLSVTEDAFTHHGARV